MSRRTRSVTRPRRVEVESMSAPRAEMGTGGVIIAVRTARAELSGSIVSARGACGSAHIMASAGAGGQGGGAGRRGGEIFLSRGEKISSRAKVLVPAEGSCAMLRPKRDNGLLAVHRRLGMASPACEGEARLLTKEQTRDVQGQRRQR